MKNLIFLWLIICFINLSRGERPVDNFVINSVYFAYDITKTTSDSSNVERDNQLSQKLSKAFSEMVKTYPNDSALLYRFYYEWFYTTENDKMRNQIERIENLLSEKNKQRYYNVEQYLKPLLSRIVANNSINNLQLDSLVVLYSDYDSLLGKGLLSQLLTVDENYQLVWKTFDIIAEQSQRDTTNIAALIELDKSIRTNAELAGEFFVFVEKAILNNPKGFIDMYLNRNNELRNELMSYFRPSTNFVKEVELLLNEIAHNTSKESYRKGSLKILNRINEI